MSEIERRLYEVLNLVETNQAAVQVAMDGLAAERTALRQERTALALQVTDLQAQMKAAVEAAVKKSLAGAAGEVVDEVKAKTDALEHNVGVMTNGVADAEFALERLIKWASSRLLLVVAAMLVVLGVVGWLASTGVQWWDEKAIASAQVEKAELEQEVANLQANKATWVQGGYQDRITQCDNRPCVAVNEGAGAYHYTSGGPSTLMILQGY
jgi:hypothetical protein